MPGLFVFRFALSSATMVLVSLPHVHKDYYIHAKLEMDIYIYWTMLICWTLPTIQLKQDDTRPCKTRRCGTETRRCPLVLKKYCRVLQNETGINSFTYIHEQPFSYFSQQIKMKASRKTAASVKMCIAWNNYRCLEIFEMNIYVHIYIYVYIYIYIYIYILASNTYRYSSENERLLMKMTSKQLSMR